MKKEVKILIRKDKALPQNGKAHSPKFVSDFNNNFNAKGEFLQDLREYLRLYFSFNLPIIPLAHRSKKPIESWKRSFEFQDFKKNSNVGLRLGRWKDGWLTALDVDDPGILSDLLTALEKFLDSIVIIKTGGKHDGYHILLKTDEPLKNQKNNSFEIKSDGTYIVFPPSTVDSRYFFLKPSDPYEAINLLQTHTIPSQDLSQVIKNLIKSGNSITETYNSNPIFYLNCRSLRKEIDEIVVVEDIDEIDKSEFIWKKLMEKFGVKVELDKAFSCVVKERFFGEEDKHPSASLHRFSNGKILYVDFHQSGNLRYRTIVEIYKLWRTGKSDKLKRRETRLWLNEMILDLNIWTQSALELNEKVESLKEKLEERLPPRWLKVIGVIFDELIKAERLALPQGAVISARYLEEKTGVDYKITNKVLNFLCAVGICRKNGKVKRLNTEYIKLENFEISEVIQRVEELIEYLHGHGGFSRFSRKAVQKVFGAEKVKEIFHREPDPELVSSMRKRSREGSKKTDEEKSEEVITLYTIARKVFEKLEEKKKISETFHYSPP